MESDDACGTGREETDNVNYSRKPRMVFRHKYAGPPERVEFVFGI